MTLRGELRLLGEGVLDARCCLPVGCPVGSTGFLSVLNLGWHGGEEVVVHRAFAVNLHEPIQPTQINKICHYHH
jgi:hypothetical protein